MHTLHKILVNIREIDSMILDRTELIERTRSIAEEFTECFYEVAFDWRVTNTAGRWENQYPCNVIFSKDDIRKFVSELEECATYQQAEIDNLLNIISETSSDIKELVELCKNGSRLGSCLEWQIYHLGKLLYGIYDSDSGFYDTHICLAKISKKTIEKVRECPDDWALVMFDYHS